MPITVTSYVVKTIRDGILSGHYPFGSRLDQKELTEELNVSIIPLREGLRQLEVEGLIRINPRRGAFVVDLSIENLNEIYLIRMTLEELATHLAVPNINSEKLDQLRDLVTRMEKAVEIGNVDLLLEITQNFHSAIYESAGKPLLMEMIANLWSRSAVYRQMYGRSPDRASRILNIHKEIYEACKSGDIFVAGQAVKKDIHQAIGDYISVMSIFESSM